MKKISLLLVLVLIEVSFPQGITLRDTTNQYDYIIITVPEFVQACQTFKQHKESYNGFNVLIVDTGQIYNVFNSDSLPENNIRDFISYAGTYWQNPKPVYFLLIGNTEAVPNFFIPLPLPGYNPYHRSDYYYSISTLEPDTLSTEFNIGRLPAFSSIELNHYFDKVIWYENNSVLADWMNTNLFLCEYDELLNILEFNQSIAQNLPENFYKKYFEDNDTSQYFGNIDSLMNFVNNQGTSILWFSGRSIDSSFMTDPPFLVLSDLTQLNNYQKYFLSIHFTQIAILDSNSNIAREMLFLENSGSIGSIVLNGLTFWPTICNFQREWASKFYTSEHFPIPEVMNTYIDLIAPYQRKVINFWGDPSLKLKYDPIVNVEELVTPLPDDFILHNNYPSPFNSSTKIQYQIPHQANVTLKIYDVLGREVATLVNEVKPAGKYEVGFTENNLTSGIYFYTLQAGNFVQTKKMILLK
jgi:hypothetical protein